MSLYNNESKDEQMKITNNTKYYPNEKLQYLLNELLNKRLLKLENSTKDQMSDLNTTSKYFQEISKNIQQISNNTVENKINNSNESVKLNINNSNILKPSTKKINERTRSNTLGISKYHQLKKQNTEMNLNRESFISNNNNNINNINNKQINKINKNINIAKEIWKNATPKRTNKIDFFIENKTKFPQTEKITKKINEKIKKINTNKNNIKYLNDLDNINIGFNKQIKEKKEKKEILKSNKKMNDNIYIKKEFDIKTKNKESYNNLRSSFVTKKEKRIFMNDKNNIDINNSNNLKDIQNIVKLVDNVNQNITKILNNNNKSIDFSIPNNLRNSARFSTENNINNINPKKNEFTLKKKYLSKKEKVKNTDVLTLFKKEKNILKNIMKYLSQKESIFFYSINNYFNKERITYLDNKKEELLSILNLKKDETIENKINEIKNQFNKDNLSHIKKFEISEETKDKIKLINIEELLKEIKNNNENLRVIYKILFIFLGEEKIYNIINKDIFWIKCYIYFNDNSKKNVIDFVVQKILLFNFSVKEFNIIENLLKENKDEIINEISNNKNFLIPLIKELLEYFGIIFSKDKTEGNIYIKNLRRNQVIINYLNNLKVRYFLSRYNEEEDDD